MSDHRRRTIMRLISIHSLVSLFGLLGIPSAESATGKIQFNRDIRPIFTTQCTSCHGGVKEAGGISFVFRDKALAKGESGNPTIVPGHPERSELIKRVTSGDPDMVMPQPEHGPPLSSTEVENLRQWIKEGAEWNEHWAFVKPVVHPVPAVRDGTWPKNDIDRFILAKLETGQLKPSPQAEPALLLRRLSVDLVGLPPTLAELDAFETAFKEDPERTYAAAVDRLLASPHFGERWASTWLDLARYADTEGLGLDRPRPAWPFRDWVIRAYNEDMPFDQFTIRQLAGDLLDKPTLDDLIATNFHRQTQSNSEGGTDDEEFRTVAVMDRVATTWETWQGVTMGCVQCHSHPYDPIEHHEYYQSVAFFNNTRDHDLDSHFPKIPVPKSSDRSADFSRWLAERSDLAAEIHEGHGRLRGLSEWRDPVDLAAKSDQMKMESEGSEFRTAGNARTNTEIDLTFQAGDGPVTALRFELLPVDPETAIHTPEWGSVLSRIRLFATTPGNGETEIPLAAVIGDEAGPVLDPNDSLNDDRNGWGAYTKIDRPRTAVIVLREALASPPGTQLRLNFKNGMIGGGSFPLVTRRGRISLGSDMHWTQYPADAEIGRARARIGEIDAALARDTAVSLPVMAGQPAELERPTRLFIRGNWLEKDETPQQPAVPVLLGSLPDNAPPDRLGFARWLVSEENPLTARVATNRFWEQLFGTGLVETLEDFGSSGAKPSHPELLDHLALRFRDHHRWSNKAMLREIVSSATYRQSAVVSAELLARDPQNRLHSRGPRGRLSAEAIRDHGLVASGLFGQELFGKPVFPPMPPGGWTPFKSGEKWDTPPPGNPDRYRRAIYTYTKRSNPYPGFATFDAPPRDLCTKRRIVSNTPLQALESLNSPAHVEFAQGLARRMKYDLSGDLQGKLAAGHRIATSRLPSPERLARLLSLFQELEAGYRERPETMEGMAGTSDGAAFTIIASLLLNLDESVVR